MSASTRVRRRSRLALIALGTVAVALLVAPASGMAVFKFGSKLDSSVQPSNASSPHACDEENPGVPCTWVMNEAYGRPNGGHKAPRRGVIRRIRLIAGAPGSFRLFTVRAFRDGGTYKGKALRRGPVIRYQGQPEDVEDTFRVEVFKVRIPIRRGVRLAIRTRQTSTLRCSSGGDNTLLYQPPLFLGQPFRRATGDDGCWLLLEAVAVRRR